MKNTHTQKRLVTKMMVSLVIFSTLLFFLVQLSPVSAQDELPARLTGVVTDDGVDTDSDGYFDYLNLGIEINVTSPATYTVDAGGLYVEATQSDNLVISNGKTMYLDVGIHVVEIALDGTTIYDGGINPTTVASIYLYNETDDIIDQLYDFPLSTAYFYDQFQRPVIVIEYNEIERTIILDQSGIITVTNAYYLSNLGFKSTEIKISFPESASDIQVRDEMGELETSTQDNIITVTFREELETGKTETLYVIYNMPWEMLVSQENGVDFNLQFTFYEQFSYNIGKLTVDITLPKGAGLLSASPEAGSITKDGLQETLSYSFYDVASSQDLSFNINYKYLVFWASFYPTIWVGIIAVVASAMFCFWGVPKTISAPTTIQVPTKDLKGFVDVYEEKAAIRTELEDLEERLQKGKIPRRKYKVRRRMLDGRLIAVSRNISSMSETIRAASSKYARMMREIEVAETKLESVKKDIQRIKTRYSRGEVSKGAYEKLLDEYQSRREDAEATIDGVLLRLRD